MKRKILAPKQGVKQVIISRLIAVVAKLAMTMLLVIAMRVAHEMLTYAVTHALRLTAPIRRNMGRKLTRMGRKIARTRQIWAN